MLKFKHSKKSPYIYIIGNNNFWYACQPIKTPSELKALIKQVWEGIEKGEYGNNEVDELYVVQGKTLDVLTPKGIAKLINPKNGTTHRDTKPTSA